MTTPPMLAQRSAPLPAWRAYDRGFNWEYVAPAIPDAPSGALLVPIYWDQLPLNGGDDDSGMTSVIELVTGWLDSPPLVGNDANRALADGSAWGPKTLGARVITLNGCVYGPRDQLGGFRDQLAMRACARYPADLTITDGGLGRTLTASVRADSDSFKQTWTGPNLYRWTVTLTAADPALYDAAWQSVSLNLAIGQTGRVYQRLPPWEYASPYLGNSAILQNDGNWPTPVYALYQGDLSQSNLTDEAGDNIALIALQPGEQIWVDTSSLTAQTVDGQSRARYIMPGSDQMTVPPASVVRWHLYASGGGQVTLNWRSAWV